MYGGEEVSGGLVVAGGDGAELLEFGEEIFDEVACLEQVAIIVTADLAVGFGRDHHGLSGGDERIDDALLGVEGFVGDQCIGLYSRQQVIGPDEIMGFTTAQVEIGGISERVD